MKYVRFLLALLLCAAACKKGNKQTEPTPQATDDVLTEAQSALFESLPDQQIDLKDILLPNGENARSFLQAQDPAFLGTINGRKVPQVYGKGTQVKKNLLVAKMTGVANYIVDASNFTFLNDGKTPKQTRLGYVLGSKDYLQRTHGPKCTDLIYGLDCSGMLYQIFKGAGVNIRTGKAKDQTAEHLQEAIRKVSGMEKIEVKDEGQIPYEEFESGDVIYFKSGGSIVHIGLVLMSYNGRLMIYQSNGSDESKCETNYTHKRGPRIVELQNPMSWKQFDGYGIIRIETDISGKWALSVRCQNQSRDLFNMNLEFPVDKDGTFSLTQTGTDYNGTGITARFDFSYDKKKNILTGAYTLDFADGSPSRKDQFSQKLIKDDTGYFVTDKVVVNGGCTLETRLENKEE